MIRYKIRLKSGRTETNEAPTHETFKSAMVDLLLKKWYVGNNFVVNTDEIEWITEVTE